MLLTRLTRICAAYVSPYSCAFVITQQSSMLINDYTSVGIHQDLSCKTSSPFINLAVSLIRP